MENNNLSRPIAVSFIQLPTIILVIGYICYWFELIVLQKYSAQSTAMALSAALLAAVYIAVRNNIAAGFRRKLSGLYENTGILFKIFLTSGLLFSAGILLAGLFAASFPPHLIQEFDALNYHITLVRQHLILGSFDLIRWSSADLFLLPLDFALAPFWLVTELPNKFPQYIFALGLLARSYSLIFRITYGDRRAAVWTVFLILGLHMMAIQLGTAMLDVVMCYLLVGALDSFLRKNYILCAWELAFYVWSKPFIPLQCGVIVFAIIFVYIVMRLIRRSDKIVLGLGHFSIEPDGREVLRKIGIYFILISFVVAGPFIYKSLKYGGTPVYPFFAGKLVTDARVFDDMEQWQGTLDAAQEHMKGKDQYGHGRGPVAFIKHFWLIAVPEKGVNNAYDYPVGLPYLICLIPFALLFIRHIRQREFALIPWFIVIFWETWWMGSHQTRFLFVPIVLLLIAVVSERRFITIPFKAAVVISLLLAFLSVVRANQNDLGKNFYDALRPQDRALIEMSKAYEGPEPLVLDLADAAYATVPILVIGVEGGNSRYVIQPKRGDEL